MHTDLISICSSRHVRMRAAVATRHAAIALVAFILRSSPRVSRRACFIAPRTFKSNLRRGPRRSALSNVSPVSRRTAASRTPLSGRAASRNTVFSRLYAALPTASRNSRSFARARLSALRALWICVSEGLCARMALTAASTCCSSSSRTVVAYTVLLALRRFISALHWVSRQ